MKQAKPQPIYLKNYKKPDYLIPEIKLHFDIYERSTRVRSRLRLQRREGVSESTPLILNGEHLKLISVRLDGKDLQEGDYRVTDKSLTLTGLPSTFLLEIENEIEPHKNTALEGLYKSGHVFCTQNEPEGFRKITYFPDRPDIMSRYHTTITAEKERYPILLSNGNEKERGDLEKGRHFVTWEDPFPKPCYLFALVAGDLREKQ